MMKGGGGAFGMEGMLEGNRRLGEAIDDLKAKHDARRAQEEAEEAIRQKAEAKMIAEAAKAERFEVDLAAGTAVAASASASASGEASHAPTDADPPVEEEDDDCDDDLARIRAARLAALRRRKEAASRTAGECREITQDEFLPSVTGTRRAVCVFTHNEFKERCDVMLKHVRHAAQLLPSTQFLAIDAAKAPFFVEKLAVKVIPTTVFFLEGKTESRMFGFEGLNMTTGGDDFTLKSLLRRLRKEGMTDKDEFMAALARIGADDDSDEEAEGDE